MSTEICRPLNTNEKVWLTQNNSSSPLCLVASFNHGVLNEASMTETLNILKLKHPYLAVCVDKATKCLKSTPSPIPLTFETVTDDTQEFYQQIQHIVRSQLSQGVARCHVVHFPNYIHDYLLLLGDHMAFDGRSFVSWLYDLNKILSGGRIPESEFHTFEDWSRRVPEVNLKARKFAESENLELLTAPPGPENPPHVEDIVIKITPEVFMRLKEESKKRGLSLNGTLMVRFYLFIAIIWLVFCTNCCGLSLSGVFCCSGERCD